MKRKLFFITFLMLFCSTMFGEGFWGTPVKYNENMILNANIKINGNIQDSDKLEIGAFCGNELRGTAISTIEDGESNVFFTIMGNNGDKISFKLYVPGGNEGTILGTDMAMVFYSDAEVGLDQLLYINFYEKHWNYTGNSENTMTVECTIAIDGVIQLREDLELAAFCDGELRGVAKPEKYSDELYITALQIGGSDGDNISFKLYDPTLDNSTDNNGELSTDYTVTFEKGAILGNEENLTIEFKNNPVARIGEEGNAARYFATLEAAVAAAEEGQTVTLLKDITLTETLAIEKAITLDLNNNTVTGDDGAIVFNVKAETEIMNGTVKGNKSGTSSGLIDIYANLDFNGVTIETSKINALRFKAGDCTATLTDCNVTGAFKGYGGSVWEINSGTYKASSTSINDQLNGTASISGGTFHYEIAEEECAPGYVVNDNGDGTWTVKYAPAAFVDANNNAILDEGEAVYGNLDQIFAKYKEGNVYVVITANIVANAQVDTDANAHYYITTNVTGGVTMNFLFEDDWNYIQKMYIGENVTLNAKYLVAWTDLDIKGTVNAYYPYFNGAKVTVRENATLNASLNGASGDALQVKGATVLTVNGTVNASTINVWSGAAKLIVSGANAKVNASWIDIWDGTPSVTVENGATLDVDHIKASRGGSIAVDGATLKSGNIELGHNGESTGELTVTNNGVIEGEINLTAVGSTVEGPEGLNVVSGVDGYGVNYYNGVYSLVQIVTQSQTLSAGWNWFSSYIDINGTTGLAKLQNALGTNGIQIKGNNSFTNYTGNEGQPWFGNLTSTSVKEMYMIKVTDNHSLQMKGNIIVPSENAIELTSGWNWIGYQLNQEIGLNDVLRNAKFTPNNGDRIKSHLGFSQYYENIGWWGTLNNMTPGVGYMYYNAGTTLTTLTYSYPAEGSRSEVRANVTAENNHWVPASSQFASNMNIIAVLDVEDEDYEIAAFVGGEVRGSARPIYVEPLDAYMFFLTVHGEGVEEMTFKCYDLATGEELSLNDRINYSDNAVLGSIEEPYKFNEILGIGENAASAISIYPNPTTTGKEIGLAATCDTVEVFNALGVKIAEYQNVDTIDAIETAGVYMIRVTNNGNVQNCRLVVK